MLGDFIRLRREELSLDQTHLARLVGVHQQTVSKWEQGNDVPQPKRIRELAEALEADCLNLMRYAGYLTEAEPSQTKGEEPFHRFMAQICELNDDQLVLLIDHAWEEHRNRAGFALDSYRPRRKARP